VIGVLKGCDGVMVKAMTTMMTMMTMMMMMITMMTCDDDSYVLMMIAMC